MRRRLEALGRAVSCACGWMLVVMAFAAVIVTVALIAALLLTSG